MADDTDQPIDGTSEAPSAPLAAEIAPAAGLSPPEISFKERLTEFRRLRRGSIWVAMLTAPFVMVLWELAWHQRFTNVDWFDPLLTQDAAQRLLFISYFIALIAMWGIYFLSKLDWRLAPKTNTLRRLLLIFAVLWDECDDNRGTSFVAATQDKARASMTMLAMLTAASALLLSRSLDLAPVDGDPWGTITRYGAAGAAMLALVCFIISVDSLDVLFNRFGEGLAQEHLVGYFYSSTRNARYYGIMFMLWAVCLFSAGYHPLFGAFAVGSVIAVGWNHWFPYPPVPARLDPDCPRTDWVTRASLLLRTLLLGLPIGWAVIAW